MKRIFQILTVAAISMNLSQLHACEKEFVTALKNNQYWQIEQIIKDPQFKAQNKINTIKCDDYSALHYAVYHKYYKTVELLAQHGANTNLLTDNGNHALSFAMATKDTEMVKILLDNKADPNVPLQGGRPFNTSNRNKPRKRALDKHVATFFSCSRSIP